MKFIFGCIVTLLFVFLVHLYNENITLTSRISTLTETNEKITHKDFQKVKEDYYIEQQNRDTTLILFTVTSLFLMFTAITFLSVRAEFKSQIQEVKTEYNNQVSEYQNSIIHIKNLEGDLSFEVGKNLINTIDLYQFEYTEEERARLFEVVLLGCEYYAKSLLYKSNVKVKFEKSVKTLISSYLGILKDLSENQQNIQFSDIDYNKFMSIREKLEKVVDQKGIQNLSFIFTKLSFAELG